MKRDESDDGLPGQDSFLDIVANMVGILIILVMVVGVRASHVATLPKTSDAAGSASDQMGAEPIKRQLRQVLNRALEEKRSIEETLSRAHSIRREAELADAKRLELTLLRATLQKEIDKRRAQLDDDKRQQFDVQRQISEKQIKLSKLTQEQIALLSQPLEVEEIESAPTPLAKEVTGEEVHVRLKNELLAVVPVKPLLAEVERRGLDYLRRGLRDRSSANDVYGPIEGFRMRLSLEVLTENMAGNPRLQSLGRRTMIQVGEFLPISDELGMPVDEALAPTSSLMRLLTDRRAAAPALVVWAYPDSYDHISQIKRTMWELGVPLAIRPLDMDQRITFSSHGTKSSAQ